MNKITFQNNYKIYLFFTFLFLYSFNLYAQQISLEKLQNNMNSNTADFLDNDLDLNSIYTNNPTGGLYNQKKYVEQKSLTSEEKNLITDLIYENHNTKTPLELDYSYRAKTDLKLQGYDFFLINYLTSRRNPVLPTGFISDDYILGAGDDLTLIFEGRENRTLRKKITSNGLLHLGFSDPINAAGRKFGEVKKQIEINVKNSLIETKVFISLENIRPVNVTVIGEVNLPGVQTLTGMSSVMDALISSGGIKRTGSLRNIILNQNGKTSKIDLYDLLFINDYKNFSNITLGNRSTIIVPQIGKTVAISGNGAKNGIYELGSHNTKLSDIIKLNGGFISKRKKNISLKNFNNNGNEKIIGNINLDRIVSDGDIAIVSFSNNEAINQINIMGSVGSLTTLPLDKNFDIKNIFENIIDINSTAYKFSFVVKSNDKYSNKVNYEIHKFSDVFENGKNVILKPMDEIIILDREDLDFITSTEVIKLLTKNNLPLNLKYSCKALKILHNNIKSLGKNGKVKYKFLENFVNNYHTNQGINKENNTILKANSSAFTSDSSSLNYKSGENGNMSHNKCPNIFLNDPELLSVLIDRAVIVTGNIVYPGVHIVENKNDFNDLIKFVGFSGGKTTISPDYKTLEVIKSRIYLSGETSYPVEVIFDDGLKASNIFANSNIINENTYPFFAVLTRKQINGNRSFIPINPYNIINNQSDFYFKKNDELKFFSNNEIKRISSGGKNVSEEVLSENNGNAKTSKIPKEQEAEYLNDNLSISNNQLISNFNTLENPILEKNSNISENYSLEDIQNGNYDNISKNNTEKVVNAGHVYFKKENKYLNLIKSHLVKVSGGVINPGFYPVAGKLRALSLINYSGGFQPNANKNKVEIVNLNSKSILEGLVTPGGQIYVSPSFSNKSHIKLVGAFEKTREINFKGDLKISSILNNLNTLNEFAYLYFGTIKRKSTSFSGNSYIPFSPINIIEGKQDLNLKKGDEIKIYTNKEIKSLTEEVMVDNRSLSPDKNLLLGNKTPSPSGSINDLVRKLLVTVNGSVGNPNTLIIGGLYKIDRVIEIFGGLSNAADEDNVILTIPELDPNGDVYLIEKNISLKDVLYKDIVIMPGTSIRVSKKTNSFSLGLVEITGAVNQPGFYRILPGDTLYSVIERAGNLTEKAYLDGLFFSREKEKDRERASIKRLQREIDKEISYAVEEASKENFSPENLLALRELARSANSFEPQGRVVGDFTKDIFLKNINITSGDKIFVPTIPSSITVAGEVMTPGSIMWSQNSDIDFYINSAAGFTDLAEKNKVFVISPNGKAERKSGFWNTSLQVLPGSTIVVPRRIKLASNIERISAITSVVYQMTLTLAGIQSILDN